mgnify:CR=1 FL=1
MCAVNSGEVLILKTSFFLALTAHYRGAVQLLRPVLENALVGLWFQFKLAESEKELGRIGEAFWRWLEGKYKIPKFEDMAEELKENLILVDRKATERWKELLRLRIPSILP